MTTPAARAFPVVVFALALLVVGCSGDGEGLKVPDGFVKAGVSGVVDLAHPATWRQVPPAKLANAPKLQVEAPEQRDGLPLSAVQVFHTEVDPATDLEAWVALQLADNRLQLPEYKVVGQRDLEVPGAAGAKLVENTYSAVRSGVSLHGFDVITLDGKGNAVKVIVAGVEVDRAVAQRIIDTVRLRT